MAKWCLAKKYADDLLSKIKSGALSYAKLRKMESADRRKLFKESLNVGESDATKLNIAFEKKLLQKDFFKAMESWGSEVTGVPSARLSAIRKSINQRKLEATERVFNPRESQSFMAELAQQKIGVGVTREEGQILFGLSKMIANGEQLLDKGTVRAKLSEIKKGKEITQKESEIIDGLLAKIKERSDIGELKTFLSSNAWKDLRRVMTEGIPDDTKEKVLSAIDSVIKQRSSSDYGRARVALEKMIGELKLNAEGNVRTEIKGILKRDGSGSFHTLLGKIVQSVFGTGKAMLGSLDASAIGRQGLHLLTSGQYKAWGKVLKGNADAFLNFSKRREIKKIEQELQRLSGNKDLKFTYLDAIKVEIYNSELGRNGIYDKMKLAIGGKEEQYAKSFAGKIPLIGTSEEAFTSGLWYARTELADRFYSEAVEAYKKSGVNLLDPKNSKELKEELLSIGKRINSMTGRGTEGLGKINQLSDYFWSPKLMQATIDLLTAHSFDSKITKFQRSEMRKDWIKRLATIGGFLGVASILPESVRPKVELNSTSSKFGTVNGIDVTGGMSGWITFLSRIGAKAHDAYSDNKIGIKSSRTGVKETNNVFGSDAMGLIADFFGNKASPGVSLIANIIDGYNFSGQSMKPDPENPLKTVWVYSKGILVPIPLQKIGDALMESGPSGFGDAMKGRWLATAFDLAGFADKNYQYSSNWEKSTAKEYSDFKEKVGSKKFTEANTKFGRSVNDKIQIMNNSKEYKGWSDKKKKAFFDKLIESEKSKIFKEYGFNPKRVPVAKNNPQDKLTEQEFSGIFK
jgi:hypothetical protein